MPINGFSELLLELALDGLLPGRALPRHRLRHGRRLPHRRLGRGWGLPRHEGEVRRQENLSLGLSFLRMTVIAPMIRFLRKMKNWDLLRPMRGRLGHTADVATRPGVRRNETLGTVDGGRKIPRPAPGVVVEIMMIQKMKKLLLYQIQSGTSMSSRSSRSCRQRSSDGCSSGDPDCPDMPDSQC